MLRNIKPLLRKNRFMFCLLRSGFKCDTEKETDSLYYSMFSLVNHEENWKGGVAF